MSKNNIEAIYPLSPMQQGLLFHTLYAPQSGVYFEQFSWTFRGGLNVLAFERAWARVVERHPVLRTLFIWERRDKPLQVVCRRVELPWSYKDWRELSPSEEAARLESFLQADRKLGFDLSKAPPMRLVLIRVAEDTYQFIWSHHHSLLDGWSASLILKEVFAYYEAFCQGQDIHLAPSRPYRDYIEWLQRQELSQAEAFWRQALKSFTTPTLLGADRALRSPEQEGRSGEQQFNLSQPVTAALQSLARQQRLTLYTLVQGAWALLLSRYSGEQEVVFGVTVSGRPAGLAGVESMVGLFINTLPVRVQVTAEELLLQWLQRLQAQQVELLQYEYTPLVEIQGWSDVPRGVPLFESILVFENYPRDSSLEKGSGGLEISDLRVYERTNYPLTVLVEPGPELSLKVDYDCSRFDAATVTRMLGHFRTLLEGLSATPERRLSDLPLLTAAERQQLLVGWNATATDYPQGRCIHHLFEAQVGRSPDAVAVVCREQQLTYQALNARANQLAHYLRRRGVGPEVLVGLCVERSLEMAVGLLGVLKAGGVYVPLDPSYPKGRLAFMLEDARAPMLLTQARLVGRLPEHRARVVCIDTDWELIAKESEEAPSSEVTADNPAYAIYTSGSTGTPKGVLITHRGLVNHNVAVAKQYGLRLQDRILQFSSISFDIAVEELLPSWISGAAVVLWPDNLPGSSTDFLRFLAQEGVTVLNLSTAYWHEWVHDLSLSGASLPGTLRLVVVGGEKASPAAFSTFLRCGGEHLRWLNTYGPTETTVIATVYEPVISQEIQEGLTGLPIGHPIANVQVYILDAHLQPVPVGVTGELYIGGVGLARGYLNRPELTAEKFIPHPFSNEPGARLYKTGDLARYLPDGNIEFLGRLDHQVKIRGFRIELGEVESVLGRHTAVQEAVVLAREDRPGDKRLVAYVVPNRGQVPTVGALRAFLKEGLPDYMVPSAFVLLDSLPLTPSRKVDRRALPAPDQARPELEEPVLAPRTPMELLIGEIWQDVLGVDRVSVHDNFFDLGGHSLLSMKVVARLENRLGLRINPRELIFQTLGQLASMCEERMHAPQSSRPVSFMRKLLDPLEGILSSLRGNPR